MNRISLSVSLGLLVAGSMTFIHVQPGMALEAQQARSDSRPSHKKGGRPGKTQKLKGKIERQIVLADDLMAKSKFAEAYEAYHEVLQHDPKNVPATVGMGVSLAKQFKLDAALDQFNKALELDPSNAVAHCGKAMVMVNRLQSSSTTYSKNRDGILSSAEAECKQGLDKDSGMPEGHFTLGSIYKEEGHLDQAVSEFQEAVKQDPQYSEGYAGLGMAQLLKGDTVAAQTAFKQAVSLNSGNSTAHYGLARCDLKNGQVDDAIKELNTSLYQNPNSAPARLAMGEAYLAQGNSIAGVQQFQESIRIKPENPDAYLHIADVRESRGDLELSIGELHSGLELMPDNLDLHQRVADESLRLEKLDDAIKEYQRVLAAHPQDAKVAEGLTRAYYMKSNKEAGSAFLASNDYASSQKLIDQAVAMNPNNIELRLAQAKLLAMSGGHVDLSKIGTPTNDGERVAYAESLLAQNKFADADHEMGTVIANATTAKQAFAVADLALMIHDLGAAEAAYKKGATMGDSNERGKRGLDAVAKAKETARQDCTMADDLSKRKQLQSAVDKYHSAIFSNPTMAEPRLGLAETLQKFSPQRSGDLREAVNLYKIYLVLNPNVPEKEHERITKRMDSLTNKAAKLEVKEKERLAKGDH